MSRPTVVIASTALLAVAGTAATSACQTRKFNSAARGKEAAGTAAQGPRTACVGIQGNGVRFPTHVGTYVALLESDIVPIASMGGSSGSIVGSAVMGLLENTNLGGEVQLEGKPLTRTQKAGVVLASMPDVFESFLFLPTINTLWDTAIDAATFGLGLAYGKALLGDATQRVASTEVVIGQSVMLVDFLKNQDFSSVLALPKFEQRRAESFKLWKEFTHAQTVTVRQLIDGANGRLSEDEAKRFDRIDDMLFRLFQRDVTERDQRITKGWRNALKAMDAALRVAGNSAPAKKLDEIALTIPDAGLLWNAYLSRAKDGSFLEVPKGMIIHATFRRGQFELRDLTLDSVIGEAKVKELHTIVDFADDVGPDKLFQGYVAAEPLYSQLRDIRFAQDKAGKGFQPYFPGGNKNASTLAYAYPASKTLVLPMVPGDASAPFNAIKVPNEGQRLLREKLRGVAHGIAYSAGEPGPFSRLMLNIDSRDRNDNKAGGKDIFEGIGAISRERRGEGIISFGGWSENVPVSTLAMLPECQNATFLVSGAKPGLGNDFQVSAIRTAMKGWTSVTRKIRDRIDELRTGTFGPKEKFVQDHFAALNNNVEFARDTLGERWVKDGSGKPTFLWNNMEFDTPSEAAVDTKSKKTLDSALNASNARFPLIIASYQKMKAVMAAAKVDAPGFSTIAFGKDLTAAGERLATKTTVKEIDDVMSSIK